MLQEGVMKILVCVPGIMGCKDTIGLSEQGLLSRGQECIGNRYKLVTAHQGMHDAMGREGKASWKRWNLKDAFSMILA